MDRRKAERGRNQNPPDHFGIRPSRTYLRSRHASVVALRYRHLHRRSRPDQGRHHQTYAGPVVRHETGTQRSRLRAGARDDCRTAHRLQRTESGPGPRAGRMHRPAEPLRNGSGHVVRAGRQSARIAAGRPVRNENADRRASAAAAVRTFPIRRDRTQNGDHLRTGRIDPRRNDRRLGKRAARLPAPGLPAQRDEYPPTT